jgi:Domain of unknown function (DUF4281)
MTASQVFLLANALVFPHWLLIIFLPKWKITIWLSNNYPISAILAILYAYYITQGDAKMDMNSFATLEGVKNLFATGGDKGMLAGWLHYLCFDLMVGCWIFNDAQSKSINHFLVIPCLFFSFMLGPVGLLLYLIVRFIKK